MTKQSGAFLTIGELAAELGIPQHILRYWETRFPALRPLQRAGNRRYYRAEDVELARRIHHLLNVEGYTVRGAQQALAGAVATGGRKDPAPDPVSQSIEETPDAPAETPVRSEADEQLLDRLRKIRSLLASAL